MNGEDRVQRPLFGGAISSCFPLRFQVSSFCCIENYPDRDESLIFELLDLKHEVGDGGSAVWFLQDIAREQDAEETMVLEHSGTLEAVGLTGLNGPAIVTTAVAHMAIAKGRQGREAQNLVRVSLHLDIMIPSNGLELECLSCCLMSAGISGKFALCICDFSPLSESARTVRAGLAIPAAQAGCLPMSAVFKLGITSFKVHDWSLFSSGA
ncbi:hypothetical protein BHE74_00011964 [Ensete ventricosum]|nr:hypothetical protein BHE74_00011964 [Ensete ventricosum]